MKVRVAALALVTIAVLGACGAEEKKAGGTVLSPATSSSTAATTATTAAPTAAASGITATTAKVTTTTARPTTTTTERVTTTTSSPAGTPVSYANCDAVRAAGKAPLYTGDPGYSTKLDRDRDGIACE